MTDDETPPEGTPIHYPDHRERAEIRPGEVQGDYERDRPAELVIPDDFYRLLTQCRRDKWAFGRITHTQHQELLAWEERLGAVNDPLAAVAVVEIGAIIHHPVHEAPRQTIKVLCPTCGAEFSVMPIEGGGA